MGPVSSSALRVTVIDNRPRLAIIRQRQRNHHFQHKHCRRKSFKCGRFYLDNCNYVQQISRRILRCLHSPKWKRLAFFRLTADGSCRFGLLFSLLRLWMGTADDTHSKMPVWRFTSDQISVCVIARGSKCISTRFFPFLVACLHISLLAVDLYFYWGPIRAHVQEFLKPGSKMSRSVFPCWVTLNLTWRRFEGSVQGERPVALPSLLWLSRVCVRHLVTAASKEAARHSLHMKDTLAAVKLYAPAKELLAVGAVRAA